MAQTAVALMCGVGSFLVGGDAVVIPCSHHGLSGPRQAGDAEPHRRMDQPLAVFHDGTRSDTGLFDEIGEG
jgi:hypothetical protein